MEELKAELLDFERRSLHAKTRLETGMPTLEPQMVANLREQVAVLEQCGASQSLVAARARIVELVQALDLKDRTVALLQKANDTLADEQSLRYEVPVTSAGPAPDEGGLDG
mgnify:FL=1